MIINGSLDLGYSNIESLGKLKEVKKVLNLESCKNLKSFGDLEKIGKLSLYDNINLKSFGKIKEIDIMSFNYDFTTPLYYIPENIKVNMIKGANLEKIDFSKISSSHRIKYFDCVRSYITYALYPPSVPYFASGIGVFYTINFDEFNKFEVDANLITRDITIKFYKKISKDWIFTNEIIRLKLKKITDLSKFTSYEFILKYEKNNQ